MNSLLGAFVNCLAGQVGNALPSTNRPIITDQGALITDTGDTLVDDAGNRIIYAE